MRQLKTGVGGVEGERAGQAERDEVDSERGEY